MKVTVWIIICICFPSFGFSQVLVGLDRVFQEETFTNWIKDKKITLITHSAAINSQGQNALVVFSEGKKDCLLNILCTLEHGFYGATPAETPEYNPSIDRIRTVSLYGISEVPQHAVEGSDILVYDVQDVGVRSYTFVTSLLHIVKASEKYNIPLIILDRPNPMGGNVIDGPLPKTNSGYIPEIPYCYGMTPGELALFYQAKYAPQAQVKVVPMKGWKRSMTFEETGLVWIPTSPQMPNAQTTFFYATTGVIGALSIASIGIGYTLPFRVIGAPWMNGKLVAEELNKARLPGVTFYPFCYEPFFGKYKMELCSGVFIVLNNPKAFFPMETQCTILGIIKTLYPKETAEAFKTLNNIPMRRSSICRSLGGQEFLHICQHEKFITWPLRKLCMDSRDTFQNLRRAYLLPEYSDEINN
ncbi:hypothetical protein CP10139811_0717 [Chlamydia ibidis]|uniref:DUF1343 domain-containing protein n=2 Tax=Chlamydia ibidis TaxID=1405396 RepID=S7KES4_9CHLA|nr:exo-beta-N-acetylmuramidase NamZ domain-containing protein [Chlamydia ibidis]EPP34681.1 hypothetical protein CP10139811_0717 [Chlamydia ibidis]EQM63128.1 hypothetical protein H359_0038 [Chlamydia ibidis 10-1398/6]